MQTVPPGDRPPIPRGAIAADLAAAVFLAIGAVVMVAGPTPRLYLGDLRLSISSPDRAILVGLLILAIRHAYVPRHPRLGRLLRRDVDDEAGIPDGVFVPVRRRLGELAAVTTALGVLVAAVTWPQVIEPHWAPDPGDPLFSTWRIAWFAHQVVRHPLQLFDGNIFHPESLTLTYSDAVIVPAAMSAPFIWMGVHQLTVYTYLLLSGFVLSGVAMYLLVHALTGQRAAALIAAVIFTVAPYRWEHYSHLELQMTMWMPLVFLGLHRTMAHGRLGDGLATGLAFALQTLSSLYYGLFLAVCLVPVTLTVWLARGRPWRPVRPLAAGAVLAALVVAPVAAQYLRNRPVLGERSEDEVRFYSATPADYLTPHFRSRWYGTWSEGGSPERHLFPGVTPVVLAAAALWPPLSAVRIGYGAAVGLAFDGTMGWNGSVFRTLREWITPYRGLRVPARFVIMVVFVLAVLSGYAVADMLRRWPRRQGLVSAALLSLAVIEPLPRLELQPMTAAPPDIYAAVPTESPVVLAEFPVGTDGQGVHYDTRYIYFSTFHWHRLVNGNSGFLPPSYLEFMDWAGDVVSDQAIGYLRSRGVTHFTVHGAFMSERRFARTVTALRRRTDVELVDRVRWEGSESRLYRLTP